MRRFLELLTEHPELLFVLVVWIAGMLGQLGKLAKKRAPTAPNPVEPAADDAPLDAEAVAREMRRILRQPEPEPVRVEPRPVQPRPVVGSEWRSKPEAERAPKPVAPTTAQRRLPLHAASHVGEAFGQRAQQQRARLGERGRAHDLGDLGGRVPHEHRRSGGSNRYALDDLKRAFVLAEVLGKPLALRTDREL